MLKLRLLGDNLLAQKREDKNKSEFVTAGDANDRGPVYTITHAAKDMMLFGVLDDDVVAGGDKPLVGTTIILKAGQYENIIVDGQIYVQLTSSDVLAVVESEA